MHEFFWACMIPMLALAALWVVFTVAYTLANLKQLSLLGILQWWAFRFPYRDIGDYMGRWWVIPEIRWLGGVRLHHIKLADTGHVHDHPFNFTTRILSGWYIELDIYGVERLRSVGDKVSRRAHEFHKIVQVSPGGCWTVFVTGPRINKWGFLVGDKKIPWRQYKLERFK